MTEWISFKNQCPPNDEFFLLWNVENKKLAIGISYGDRWHTIEWNDGICENLSGIFQYSQVITIFEFDYWRPLPFPPKE